MIFYITIYDILISINVAFLIIKAEAVADAYRNVSPTL